MLAQKHSTKGTMRKRNVSMMVEMCVSPLRYYVSLMKLIPRFQQEGFLNDLHSHLSVIIPILQTDLVCMFLFARINENNAKLTIEFIKRGNTKQTIDCSKTFS